MEFLASVFRLYQERAGWFLELLGTHILLSGLPLALPVFWGYAWGFLSRSTANWPLL